MPPIPVLLAAAPSPSPTPVPVDPNAVTPGVLGFLAILFVAVVTVLLIVDMNRRIRRTRYRAQAAERRDAPEPDGEDPPR